MEKDKSPCLPPMSGRVPGFSSSGNAANTSNTISETGNLGQTSDSNRFSHDISKMPDNPPKNLGHRRAHSEIITLPDDINFDGDLGVVGAADGPSYSDETEDDMLSMYLDIDKFNSSSVTSMFQVAKSSAMTAPNSGPSAAVSMGAGTATSGEENASAGVGSSEKPRIRHQHSQSMDGSTSIKPEMLLSGSDEVTPADSKKAMSAAKLAELALIDPKRAKRIWANRQSAARSKERKMRYIAELERKIQTLQTEATSLAAQLTLLQKDSTGMSAENSELKLRLQTMEQQVYLQDSLNDALKEEIQHLKVLTAQPMPNGGPMMNFASFGASQQYIPNNHAMQALLTAQQFQQLQIQLQKHQHQFPPHQLHQLQQQLQLQQEHQQQSGEMRVRGSMPSPNRRDGPSSSDVSSTASND
ncbi:hypothetical protein ERO13_A09G212100v2 [Gossypium hirsutum]|uniref:BZIP domain-containing protein n=3 Tax=Gossypium TaxID=3633 RepID=A0A5J5UIN2_GOSBA|nr:probable transcription factor PosF21 [Gossypium hirsutum]XP_016748119.2 probable transcription factor PosF21 [Gossypium hirsutum]KAB2067391.1 hypothetical protein ES319_A09G222900v1 [Gossypium barbadense]KAB2067392.1 hypothetical protein ES319_A09G222900v1 [Gossypium barbadense]KAG4185108.1 hypothetical protein ERO13_A09G212100v2 [Gossypium hirsutum]KAG4185109.1 hypothetical protein ERO13_A09G212100v2 [Gossypium hirsutum]